MSNKKAEPISVEEAVSRMMHHETLSEREVIGYLKRWASMSPEAVAIEAQDLLGCPVGEVNSTKADDRIHVGVCLDDEGGFGNIFCSNPENIRFWVVRSEDPSISSPLAYRDEGRGLHGWARPQEGNRVANLSQNDVDSLKRNSLLTAFYYDRVVVRKCAGMSEFLKENPEVLAALKDVERDLREGRAQDVDSPVLAVVKDGSLHFIDKALEVLFEHGFRADTRSSRGETAYEWALQDRADSVVDTLVRLEQQVDEKGLMSVSPSVGRPNPQDGMSL